jgi:hypothetical protein
MKTLLLTLSILFSSLSIGQVVVEVQNNSIILYRGYDNKCVIAPIESEFDELIVDNGTIEKSASGDKYSYIINPGEGRTCGLYAIKKTKKQIDTVDFRYFLVRALPEPTLYFGDKAPGEKVNKYTDVIICKYSDDISIVGVTFEIVSWEFSYNEKLITGVSNKLSSDVMSCIADIPSGESMSIVATVKNPDGITKKVAGTYTRY